MKLDFENSIVVLEDAGNNLKKYQSSQLKFYGYIQRNSTYLKMSNHPNADVPELIDYLNHENLEVDYSLAIIEIIESNSKRKEKVEGINEFAKNIKNGNVDGEILLPFLKFLNTLPRKLKQHQIKAALHLYVLKNAANFSVPGSGKTSVVLSVYEKYKTEDKCNILFVVGPPSCFQPWQSEFLETLGRKPKTKILSGISKQRRIEEYYNPLNLISELYLCTYQTLANDYKTVISFFSQKDVNVFLIIDEAHYVKQIGGNWAYSVLETAKYSKYRCVLTGTPIPKSYKDIFNLFDILFNDESPLNDEDKINIDLWEKNKKSDYIKPLLDEKIGHLFYRVRKIDLGLKPAIFHEPIIVSMNPYEKTIHELVKAKIYEINQRDFLLNEEILSKLWRGRMIRLRQSVSYPKLLFSAIDGYNEKLIDNSELVELIINYDNIELPAKLQVLLKKVLELKKSGEKVLIWSNFIATLKLIKRKFKEHGLRSEIIYGKTPIKRNINSLLKEEKTRDEIRDEFVNMHSGLDILIANPAAFAESVSLHKACHHAFYYDLSYNCAQYLQSLDRIHRVGGSETTEANYYFLQYDTVVDKDIKRNLEIKAQKMYDIIDKEYEIYNLDMFQAEEDDDFSSYKRIFSNY